MSLRHALEEKARQKKARDMFTAGLLSRDEYERLTGRKPRQGRRILKGTRP